MTRTLKVRIVSSKLFAAFKWQVSKPSFMNEDKDVFDQEPSNKYWLEFQLDWGDFDSHDIKRYRRVKCFLKKVDKKLL